MPSGVYQHRKGRHWKASEETKKKISSALKGRIPKNLSYLIEMKKRNKMSQEKRNWIKNKRNRTKRILNNNGSNHTFGEWEILKTQYDWICPSCRKKEPEIKLTEDHIIPLSKGGSDNIENIQPLCRSCNTKKHTKIIKYQNCGRRSSKNRR